MCSKFCPVLLGLALLTGCSGSTASKIDAICSSVFPEGEPGAAVLVLKGDKVVFEKGYGLADLGTCTPIDGNTSFNIASVSKQFTAVAVLQLEAAGLLSLEDSVAKFFPEFTGEIWKDVRIKHLLSHSSGVPDAREAYTLEQKINGDEELALEFMPALEELHFSPGTDYEYVNPTYVLLGRLVEKISGESFADYVREHIFLPAGMTQTVYFDRDNQELIPNMAHGYEYADVSDMPEERTAEVAEGPKDWFEYDFGEETFFATRPDGGIYTCVNEFVKWEKALRSACVLPDSLLTEAMRPHTEVYGSDWSDYQNRANTWYGYGWFIEPKTSGSPLRVYHTGDNGGFKILAARYPEQKVLILVFANRADWDRYQLLLELENIVL